MTISDNPSRGKDDEQDVAHAASETPGGGREESEQSSARHGDTASEAHGPRASGRDDAGEQETADDEAAAAEQEVGGEPEGERDPGDDRDSLAEDDVDADDGETLVSPEESLDDDPARPETLAVIGIGGRQRKVRQGDILYFDRTEEFATEGVVRIQRVLAAIGENVILGTPTIDGAEVVLEPLGTVRGKKVISFKKRRRKHGSQRRRGFRRDYVRARVAELTVPGLVARTPDTHVIREELSEG